MVPLSAFTTFGTGNTPTAVYQNNLFAGSTISFNLAPGVSLGEATAAVDDLIHFSFQGLPGRFNNRSPTSRC